MLQNHIIFNIAFFKKKRAGGEFYALCCMPQLEEYLRLLRNVREKKEARKKNEF
jgi:hypothetical protein